MRFLAMLAILPLVAFGRALPVPTLPPSEFADTEVGEIENGELRIENDIWDA